MNFPLNENIIVFDCQKDVYTNIKKDFKKFYGRFDILKTSDLLKNSFTPPEWNNIKIIKQDLPIQKLKSIIELLIDKYIYPKWINSDYFAFISGLPRIEFFQQINNSIEIHSDFNSVFENLLLENLIFLLENKKHDWLKENNYNYFKTEKGLDKNQLEAINNLVGTVKVLAPAGSGKTKTLVNRIINLLNHGANPKRILAVAFNKKAMLEMKNRLEGFGILDVDVRTLHSLGYQIIREKLDWKYKDKENLRIQKSLLYQILQKTKKDYFLSEDKIEQILDIIRRVKLEIINYEKLNLELDEASLDIKYIFTKYIELQKKEKFLTFDDMIYFSLIFLMTNKTLRDKYQDKYDFILVDEFQDLNNAQFSIIKILSMKTHNIFIVGDDDQLIYNWCGADASFIKNFKQNSPLLKTVILSKNYRSSNIIIERSKWLIDNNKNRYYKDIQCNSENKSGDLQIKLCNDLNEQCLEATNWILHNCKSKSWKDFAILFRYNIYEILLASYLDNENIPHTPVDYSRLFKTNVGILLFAYINLIINPFTVSREHLILTLRKPNKYIAKKTIHYISDWGDLIAASKMSSIPYFERKNLTEFIENTIQLHQLFNKYSYTPSQLIENIVSTFNMFNYFSRNSFSVADIANDHLIYEVIYTLSKKYSSIKEFYDLISSLLNEDEGTFQNNEISDSNCVILSSIHRVKGNEYKNVIYFNLGDNKYFINPTEEEDERRVVYVGITRAKENLFITADNKFISKYLKEIVLNPRLKGISTKQLNSLYTHMQKNKLKCDLQSNVMIGEIENELNMREIFKPKKLYEAI